MRVVAHAFQLMGFCGVVVTGNCLLRGHGILCVVLILVTVYGKLAM